MDLDPARLVLEALEREGVRYAVFGAVALGIHGLARATEALDVFLAPEADNVWRLKRALHGVFADPSIDEITSENLLGEYPAVQYVPPEGAFHLDIVTRLGEALRWQDLEVLRAPFEGLTVSVVSPRTLFRMKSATVRAKDRADAEILRRRFGSEVD